jgi:hypothetical protein
MIAAKTRRENAKGPKPNYIAPIFKPIPPTSKPSLLRQLAVFHPPLPLNDSPSFRIKGPPVILTTIYRLSTKGIQLLKKPSIIIQKFIIR